MGLTCQDGKHRSICELAGWTVCRRRPPPPKGAAAARRCRHVRKPPPQRRTTSCCVEHGIEKQYSLWAGTLTSPCATRHADLGAKALCPARPSQSRFERQPTSPQHAHLYCSDPVHSMFLVTFSGIGETLTVSESFGSLFGLLLLTALRCCVLGPWGLATATVCAYLSTPDIPPIREPRRVITSLANYCFASRPGC